MQLIHKTNYWGKWIDAGQSNGDDDVSFDAIWVQVLRDNQPPCCHGFGNRTVYVVDSDFVRQDAGWWSLFLVNGRRGHNPNHYFYKFVAIPQGLYGYGKRGCANRGWIYKGEFRAKNALSSLGDLLSGLFYQNKFDDDKNHYHLGIWMNNTHLYAGRG